MLSCNEESQSSDHPCWSRSSGSHVLWQVKDLPPGTAGLRLITNGIGQELLITGELRDGLQDFQLGVDPALKRARASRRLTMEA